MASRRHQQFLADAHRFGHSTEQAEEALRHVKEEEVEGARYVSDLYDRALMRLDSGGEPPSDTQRSDAQTILAQQGRGEVPPDVGEAVAPRAEGAEAPDYPVAVVGSVDEVMAGVPGALPVAVVGSVDEIISGVTRAMADPEDHQRAEEHLSAVLDVFRARPNEALCMIDVGPAAGLGPEDITVLRLALHTLETQGVIVAAGGVRGHGPSWTLAP